MQLDLQILEEQLFLGISDDECPYLPGKKARFVFLDGRGVGNLYRLLLDHGYRRHGNLVYRTACPDCNECKVLRIPVESFRPSNSQKRIEKRGDRIFRFETGPLEKTEEKTRLLQDYLRFKHNDSSEKDPYSEFFTASFLSGQGSFETRIYTGDKLVGVGIVDRIANALSSVYFYFHPEYAKFSPGVYSLIQEIRYAQREKIAYYYPGFYIADCPAMNYKADFKPCQIKNAKESFWHEKGNVEM